MLEVTLIESESYRFGNDLTTYSGLDPYFEANISTVDMKTYLGASWRMGALASAVTVTSVPITKSTNYVAGVRMRFEFANDTAKNAFVAMTKLKFSYTWSTGGETQTSTEFREQLSVDYLPGSRLKYRLTVPTKTISSSTINPFNRQYHSVPFGTTPSGSESYMFNGSESGFDDALIKARPTTMTIVDSITIRINVERSFTDGASVVWLLDGSSPANEIDVHIGSMNIETVPLTVTTISDGAGSEIGVDNNAGYFLETIGTPGIVNTIVCPCIRWRVQQLVPVRICW